MYDTVTGQFKPLDIGQLRPVPIQIPPIQTPPPNSDSSRFRPPPQFRPLSIQTPHFDLKSWVTGGTKIRSNFLGQNDSTKSYSLSALREKLSRFGLKNSVEL